MPEKRDHETKKCPNCGKEFICSASSRCWCYAFDISPENLEIIEDKFSSCLCPDCLKLYARA